MPRTRSTREAEDDSLDAEVEVEKDREGEDEGGERGLDWGARLVAGRWVEMGRVNDIWKDPASVLWRAAG